MKTVLVIDINDELLEDYENFYVDYDLRAHRKNENYNESIKYVEDCPLKPLPEIKIERLENLRHLGASVRELQCYAMGHDDCIEEILGESEDDNQQNENANK